MEERVKIPDAFIERIKHDWPEDADAILAGLEETGKTSIQFNPLKSNVQVAVERQVPWFKEAEILEERPVFPLDPSWHNGSFYVQDASSMFLGHVLKDLNLPDTVTALDLCGSPGGKSLIFQNILKERLRLVANEILPQRNPILRENILKSGYGSAMVTQSDASSFRRSGYQFDVVLVDAPCSGEGMFRKDMVARSEWSEGLIEKCARRQEDILDDIVHCVKPGSYLIYSTCTFARDENEAQIERLLDSGEWEVEKITIDEEWGLKEALLEDGGHCGYRFFPHRLKAGEGLFMAVLKKKGSYEAVATSPKKKKKKNKRSEGERSVDIGKWMPENRLLLDHFGVLYAVDELQKQQYDALSGHVKFTMPGIEIGEIKGRDLIPAHALAMLAGYDPGVPRVELNREEALDYLRRNAPSPDKFNVAGWQMVCYEGQALGWVKALPNRVNNYYPKGWRLLLS